MIAERCTARARGRGRVPRWRTGRGARHDSDGWVQRTSALLLCPLEPGCVLCRRAV